MFLFRDAKGVRRSNIMSVCLFSIQNAGISQHIHICSVRCWGVQFSGIDDEEIQSYHFNPPCVANAIIPATTLTFNQYCNVTRVVRSVCGGWAGRHGGHRQWRNMIVVEAKHSHIACLGISRC